MAPPEHTSQLHTEQGADGSRAVQAPRQSHSILFVLGLHAQDPPRPHCGHVLATHEPLDVRSEQGAVHAHSPVWTLHVPRPSHAVPDPVTESTPGHSWSQLGPQKRGSQRHTELRENRGVKAGRTLSTKPEHRSAQCILMPQLTVHSPTLDLP